jgi:hypothetical protein
MATISFAPSAPATAPAAVIAEPEIANKEIAVKEVQPLATQTTPPPAGVEGEITASDIKPPRINLVQKTGKLGDEFTPGAFVYDKAFPITDGKSHFNATILRFKKYYQQKLAFGESTDAPLKFDTAAEVRANGGQVSQYDGENYYQDAADILLAIEAPANVDEEHMAFFPYNQGDKNYGLAVYTVTSSGFTSIGKRIITDATLLLRNGLWTGQYKITSERRTSAQNSWFVPVASFDKKHTPEAAEFFRAIAGL